MERIPFISIVCPCYNEEFVVIEFLSEVKKVLLEIPINYEIICVNDGSSDNTLKKLISLKNDDKMIKIINFSRNFGKEAALTAGIDYSRGDAVIPIDVDFQDPPSIIKQLIDKWHEGYDAVLAKRIDRSTDSLFKRVSAKLFYQIHNKISDVEIPENVGDCRLMSRKVVDSLKQLPENQRFMKGLFSWIGYTSTIVEYKRLSRKSGKSSFNGWKLWNFALDGFTSFGTLPLRVWLYAGIFISLLSFLYGSFIIIKTLFFGIDVPGYASLMATILFLGGIQLIGIGVLGEYIGRIYKESKRRPTYIIENIY